MTECNSCPFDLLDCDECDYPEVDNVRGLYRDTCNICGTFIMIPFDAQDRFNLVLCKDCSELEAKDVYEELGEDYEYANEKIGTFGGVFTAGTYKWW